MIVGTFSRSTPKNQHNSQRKKSTREDFRTAYGSCRMQISIFMFETFFDSDNLSYARFQLISTSKCSLLSVALTSGSALFSLAYYVWKSIFYFSFSCYAFYSMLHATQLVELSHYTLPHMQRKKKQKQNESRCKRMKLLMEKKQKTILLSIARNSMIPLL